MDATGAPELLEHLDALLDTARSGAFESALSRTRRSGSGASSSVSGGGVSWMMASSIRSRSREPNGDRPVSMK